MSRKAIVGKGGSHTGDCQCRKCTHVSRHTVYNVFENLSVTMGHKYGDAAKETVLKYRKLVEQS